MNVADKPRASSSRHAPRAARAGTERAANLRMVFRDRIARTGSVLLILNGRSNCRELQQQHERAGGAGIQQDAFLRGAGGA